MDPACRSRVVVLRSLPTLCGAVDPVDDDYDFGILTELAAYSCQYCTGYERVVVFGTGRSAMYEMRPRCVFSRMCVLKARVDVEWRCSTYRTGAMVPLAQQHTNTIFLLPTNYPPKYALGYLCLCFSNAFGI
jgi:hypothetical protein